MPTPYKQSYILVMDSGKFVKWTGYGEDLRHGKGLAIAHATAKTGEQVWDIASRPVKP